MEQVEGLDGGCACCADGLDETNALRVRGGDCEVVAEPEVFVYADQDLLQLDDLGLQMNPRGVVAARVGLPKFAICAVVCCLDLGGCAAYQFIFAVTVVPCSLVEAPSYVATERFDGV